MNDDNYLYKATIQVTEDGWGHVISEDKKPSLIDNYITQEKNESHLIRDGYGTLDVSKIMVHEEDLPTAEFQKEKSESIFYMSSAPKEIEVRGYKCPNCGCGIIIIHCGKPDEELFCPYCKEKLNQTGRKL